MRLKTLNRGARHSPERVKSRDYIW